MSDFLEKAKEHFSKFGRQEFYIEELQETVYFDPVTLADNKRMVAKSKGNEHEMAVYCLIDKCLDKEGKPVFDVGDKHALMNQIAPDVVRKIFAAIMLSRGTYEDAEKN